MVNVDPSIFKVPINGWKAVMTILDLEMPLQGYKVEQTVNLHQMDGAFQVLD